MGIRAHRPEILLLFLFIGSGVTLIRSVFLRDLPSKTRNSCPRTEPGHRPAGASVRQHPGSAAQASSHPPGQTGRQSLLPQVQVRLEPLDTTQSHKHVLTCEISFIILRVLKKNA